MRIFLRNQFCRISSFISAENILPVDTHSYVSSAWGTTSWLDHVIVTADAKDCIANMSDLYDYINSYHHPVSFSIDSDVVPECVNINVDTNEIKQVIHWDTLLAQYIDAFNTWC